MANAYSRLADPPGIEANPNTFVDERNRQTIQGMVDGFAKQDIHAIMSLIADDAVYCDVTGKGVRGDEYHGKAAIKMAFIRQFELAGTHTYRNARIMGEGECAFASWTMVVGNSADPSAPIFEGIDEFTLNDEGKIILKKAWLKGQPRLRRSLMAHNPAALFRHFRYSLKSLGQ